MPMKARPIAERFASFCMPVPMCGCWLWTGALDRHGYGRFNLNPEKESVLAHRVAYELVHGAIAAGLEIDHLCRVLSCVNPAHLEAVTHKTNMHRSPTVRHNGQRAFLKACGVAS